MPDFPRSRRSAAASSRCSKGGGSRASSCAGAICAGRWPPILERRVAARRVVALARRAKYLLFHLDNDQTVLAHLGMSGRLVAKTAGYRPRGHDHLVFETDDGTAVVYNDPRRLRPDGSLRRRRPRQPSAFAPSGAGPARRRVRRGRPGRRRGAAQRPGQGFAPRPDPPSPAWGNIYACESLHRAGVSPRRLARNLGAARAERTRRGDPRRARRRARRRRILAARLRQPRPANPAISSTASRSTAAAAKPAPAAERCAASPRAGAPPSIVRAASADVDRTRGRTRGGRDGIPKRSASKPRQGGAGDARPTEGAERAEQRTDRRTQSRAGRFRSRRRHRRDRHRGGRARLRSGRRYQGNAPQNLYGRLFRRLHRAVGPESPAAASPLSPRWAAMPRRRLRTRHDVRHPDRRGKPRIRPAGDPTRNLPRFGRHAAPAARHRQGQGDGPDPHRRTMDAGEAERADSSAASSRRTRCSTRRSRSPRPSPGCRCRRPSWRRKPSTARRKARFRKESCRSRVFYSTFALEDQKEGMAAFVEKRAPEFRNR